MAVIRSFRSRNFRRQLDALPAQIQRLTHEAFLIWKADPWHASLHFKKLKHEQWSARVGAHYRAVGYFVENGFLWDWIGTHEAYNQLIKRL